MDSINCVMKSPKMEVESMKPTEKPMDLETENNLNNIVVDDQIPSTSMETTEYEQICASFNPHEKSSQHNSISASPLDGDQVCASASHSTNVTKANQKTAIEKINRELLMSVIDKLTSKQQELQASESALLSRIICLENELKDSHLKHVICARKLAQAQQELEEAQKIIKQKDRALNELRDECNALNTSVNRSNEAVFECGKLHNTNKERDDACQEMQRIKNDYNEKISKMKSTMDSYKQKMKEAIQSMRHQANSLDQLVFDEI